MPKFCLTYTSVPPPVFSVFDPLPLGPLHHFGAPPLGASPLLLAISFSGPRVDLVTTLRGRREGLEGRTPGEPWEDPRRTPVGPEAPGGPREDPSLRASCTQYARGKTPVGRSHAEKPQSDNRVFSRARSCAKKPHSEHKKNHSPLLGT